jgi:hypothetical protein
MTTKFKYEAKDATGKVVKGSVSAVSQAEAVADLRRRNLTPVDVSKAGGFASWFQKAPGGKKPMAKKASCKKGELEVFTRQLSTMLSAGIPMLEALEILADQAESPGFAYCLDRVVSDIRSGSRPVEGAGAAQAGLLAHLRQHDPRRRSVRPDRHHPDAPRRVPRGRGAPAQRDQVGDDLPGHLAGAGHRHRLVPDDRHRAVVQAGVRVARGRAAGPDGVHHGHRVLHARLLVPDLRRHGGGVLRHQDGCKTPKGAW